MLAYIWAGWIWGWILHLLGYPVSGIWAAQAYLTTNIAKYLPGNLFHLYGRTLKATEIGVPPEAASLSVLLDTLLMAAAGLIIGLLSIPKDLLIVEILSLVAVLSAIHPRILNSLLRYLGQLIGKQRDHRHPDLAVHRIKHYPIRPLLGELGFIILRGGGFVLAFVALSPISLQSVPALISVFSIGWLLGFITPGAPGGLGIFEVTVITLLNHADILQGGQSLSPGMILSIVALYRLISTLAEAIAAGLAWLDIKLQGTG
jgi:hypothetical protein